MEKLEALYIINRNVKCYSHCGKQLLKKLKIELSFEPEILLLSIYPKELKVAHARDFFMLTSIAALFTIAETWKCPYAHLQING